MPLGTAKPRIGGSEPPSQKGVFEVYHVSEQRNLERSLLEDYRSLNAIGLMQGEMKSRYPFTNSIVFALVRKGLLSEEDAAAQAEISAEEFRAKMTASE